MLKMRNEQGMAVIELIPILVIIALLLNFSLGFFGVVHTGVLNSIAARNYAFETFRHKADLRYFMRERTTNPKEIANYMSKDTLYNFRIHGISSDKRPGANSEWVATARQIAFIQPFGGVDKDGGELFNQNSALNTNRTLHNNIASSDQIKQNGVGLDDKFRVFPVWIRPQYGICLNNDCGEN